MSVLATEGVPVAVTLRVLKLSPALLPCWRKQQVATSELVEVSRSNALFRAHDAGAYGYRLLADDAAESGEVMCRWTAWRICRVDR